MSRRLNVLSCAFLLLAGVACSSETRNNLEYLIPEPVSIIETPGSLTLDKEVGVAIVDSTLLPAVAYLEEILPAEVRLMDWDEADIRIAYEDSLEEGGYELDVNRKNVNILAADYSGAASAIATVRQLLPASLSEDNMTLPAAFVKDAPRFTWRGMHLDVSRHFYNKEEVMRLLDLMAVYKFNKFHWHLTDDQGWRIEIRQYPLLTEKGAWRELNWQDRECLERAEKEHNPDLRLQEDKLKTLEGKTVYGGYYTQEDIREVVAYAAERGIDVIPEIDMPGHFLAAIDEYPYVTCKGQQGWGQVFSSPVCVGNDKALEFCKNVWREVFELFPYEYVHIGGDEVDKANWKRCPDCRRRVRTENLESAEALQAWFIRNMENFFNENGKHLMGWDEIVEDGLSDQAVISWWRSWVPDAVAKATGAGMKAVICPSEYMYFDYPADADNLGKIYNWEPVPAGLSPEQQNLVWGVQCNVWTEWIPTVDRMDYMIFPRALAVSERAWTRQDKEKDLQDFENRLVTHIARMDEMDVHYRIPDLTGFWERNVFVDSDVLDIKCLVKDVEIRYTTDGSVPNRESALYEGPIDITETTLFKLRTFRPDGTAGDIVEVSFSKEDYLPAAGSLPELEEGLHADWYDFRGNTCKNITTAPFNGSMVAEKVCIPESVRGNIGLLLEGYIHIPEDGIYTFSLLSDDGSILELDGQTVVDNDGPHGPKAKQGQKALRKGLHRINVSYYDFNGGKLALYYIDGKGERVECPASWFSHAASK